MFLKLDIFFAFIFVSLTNFCFSQANDQAIVFKPVVNNEVIEIGHNYYLNSIEDSVKIEVLKFYIGDIKLFLDGALIETIEKKYHLIDLADSSTTHIPFKVDSSITYNKIQFQIGIDSTTNVSGAYGGDLDPIHGMYWTWQSGYINFKLEGVSNKCLARKNRFQYHIGGYAYPYNAIQTVELSRDGQNTVVGIDLNKFFDQIDFGKNYQVMSPSKNSVTLAQFLKDSFIILP